MIIQEEAVAKVPSNTLQLNQNLTPEEDAYLDKLAVFLVDMAIEGSEKNENN